MSGMDVNARLTLDATGFIGPMTKAQAQASATARSTAKAAKDAAAAQAVAAKFAGDAVSEQSVRILAARKAEQAAGRDFGQVQALIRKGVLDEATASQTAAAALQRLTTAKLATAAATAKQNAEEAHAVVSQRMAASAAVRGVENGNVGIRAVENFLTTIPGVGAALQKVFPILGAGAFIGLLVEMGEKGVEAFRKVQQSAYATRDAFQATHDQAQVRIDDLEIENQKIQDQIAKISGHPTNGLASALLEGKKMADDLVISLQEDRKQLDALLKEHDTGMLGHVLSAVGAGAATTGQQQREMLNDQSGLISKVRDLAVERDAALVGLTDPKQIKVVTDRYTAAVHGSYQQQIDAYHREAKRLRDEQAQDAADVREDARHGVITPVIDNSQKIGDVEGRAKQLEDMQRVAGLQAKILAGNIDLGKAKQNKEQTGLDNKANEQRLKAMEEYVAEWKTLAPVTAKAVYDYWDAQRNAFATGSEQFRQIVEKQAALAEEGARKVAEAISRQKERTKQLDEEKAKLPQNPMEKYDRDQRQAGRERISEQSRNDSQQVANAASEDEARIAELVGRRITQVAAATELASLHTKEYTSRLLDLQLQQRLIQKNGDLTPEEKEKRLGDSQRAINQAEAGRRVQVMKDQFALDPGSVSVMVGMADAMNGLARAWTNFGANFTNLLTSGLNSTNQGIVKELTERHTRGQHIFGNVGSDVAKNATGTLLQGAEGSFIKGLHLDKLGLGGKDKPTGALGDAIHTIVDNQASSSAAAAASTIASKASGIGGFFSKLFGGGAAGASSAAADSFDFTPILGFAGGVTNFSGGMAMVGEEGPELAYLPRGSNVIPNHKLPEVMGGSSVTHEHHYNIDARGATDPAQVEAAIRRATPGIAAQGAAMAVSHMKNKQDRTPGTRRHF